MITGQFNSVDVPAELEAGKNIVATTNYTANNTEGSFSASWKVFITAESPVFSLLFNGISLGTVVRADRVTEERSYNLSYMPNRDIDIYFRLWAHDDSGYAWDWEVYDNYLMTGAIPSGLHLLSTEVRSINVTTTPPPPPPDFPVSGTITLITPTTIQRNKPVDIYVTFVAYNENPISLWYTHVAGIIGGMTAIDQQTHSGADGSRTRQVLHFGVMPDHDITGYIALRAHSYPAWLGDWVELDRKNVTIEVTETPPPDGDGEPQVCDIDADCPPGYICKNGSCVKEGTGGFEFSWEWLAIGAGALLLLMPDKKPSRGKRKRTL